ncbi:unnamed protein product, partial [Brassica rapa subsp. trilocularis]
GLVTTKHVLSEIHIFSFVPCESSLFSCMCCCRNSSVKDPFELAWGEAERYQWFDKACGQVYEVEAFIAKGRGDYYEEGLITWFGVQPSS